MSGEVRVVSAWPEDYLGELMCLMIPQFAAQRKGFFAEKVKINEDKYGSFQGEATDESAHKCRARSATRALRARHFAVRPPGEAGGKGSGGYSGVHANATR